MATYGYLCPTPTINCGGSLAKLSASLDKKGLKKHSTPEQAFKCYCNYLVNVKGYKKLSARTFAPPDGGPVESLTRPSRFGARLRSGKGDDKGGKKASRGMPCVNHAGVIVST